MSPSSQSFELRVARGPAFTSSPLPLPEDGRFVPIEALWSGSRSTSDRAFRAFLEPISEAARRGEVRLSFPPFRDPIVSEPGAWNLVGDGAFALEHPDAWDYLSASSPNFALKRFERRLYLAHLEGALATLPIGAPVLDVGGGIGRFASEWLARGHGVTLADANGQALALALGHLSRVGAGPFRIEQLAAEDLSSFADEAFFAVSAMEVFCYLSDPARGFSEAARVLRDGGLLIASVETPVGSLPLGERHSREAIAAVQSITELSIEGDTWVRYFSEAALRAACEEAGLEVELLVGTHFLTDGPMHHLVDVERLGDEAYETALIEFEQLLAASRKWSTAARAWLVVARKPPR